MFPKLQPKQAPPWSLGMTMQAQPASRMQAVTREIGAITIVEIKGRITIGEGSVMLREIMVGLLEKGKKHLLLNMTDVTHVDSAGIGELVRSHTSVRKQGGQLKLANVNKKVQELLQKTLLLAVLDVHQDETSAVKSFGLDCNAAG
jgi:anti-sigma B factor antagonist